MVACGRQREGDLLKAQASTIKCQIRRVATESFVVACTDNFVELIADDPQKEEGFP